MEVRIKERAHQHFTVHVIFPLFPAFEFSYFLKYLQPNESGFNEGRTEGGKEGWKEEKEKQG